jgi:biotin synthase-related radical SAM superfamily protein
VLLVVLIRASIGTLAVLGLVDLRLAEKPTTAYFLQYSPSGCSANCAFCAQSRSYRGGERLGRVTWPLVDLEAVEKSWRRSFTRICLQTVIKPGFIEEALGVIRAIRSFEPELPVSLATTPIPRLHLEEARRLGVDALGVGLDAATEELFEKWRKPYSWDLYWRFIERAVEVYGRGNVYVHLIAGLGESLRDLVEAMKRVYRLGGRVALFNYTSSDGRPRVDVKYYRLAQLARFLLENSLEPDLYIDYEKGSVKRDIPVGSVVEAFYTSGCPGCNRPFYNESPRGPLYNIPSQRLLLEYYERLREELRGIGAAP